MPTLADQIRAFVAHHPYSTTFDAALFAVVDKCEQMRAESASHPGGVGHFLADEFESVIARELGITTEETS